MCNDLVLLAGGTALDVLSYPLIHSRPGSVSFGLADGFIPSRVSCCRVIMY